MSHSGEDITKVQEKDRPANQTNSAQHAATTTPSTSTKSDEKGWELVDREEASDQTPQDEPTSSTSTHFDITLDSKWTGKHTLFTYDKKEATYRNVGSKG
ncbi:uncharacterized protein RCC_11273 [Ramularia collo-cygni]|uniref:Uncharacterized protein n=1 Tax=Ramularia collo-cygni TaxID=112498 RepID=A0A2D3VEI1_9PEZI|nr:uncharacterized protein RCC_11273 [Ramularia collo-cygni]CZT25540.1 uncharacterized protein RCC_11273 [Ramularia collo-cygni]